MEGKDWEGAREYKNLETKLQWLKLKKSVEGKESAGRIRWGEARRKHKWEGRIAQK